MSRPLQLPSTISYVPCIALDVHSPFKFVPRTAPIDWKLVKDKDVGRIIRRADISSLAEALNNLAFTKVGVEGVSSACLMKYVQLAQLTIEYLLYSQACYRHQIVILEKEKKELAHKNMELREKYQAIKSQLGEVIEMYRWENKDSLILNNDKNYLVARYEESGDGKLQLKYSAVDKKRDIEEIHEKICILKEKLLGNDNAEVFKLKKTIAKLQTHYNNLENEVLKLTEEKVNLEQQNKPIRRLPDYSIAESIYRTPKQSHLGYASSRFATQPTKFKDTT
eukprot:TRINITY_DN8386_c0_g2_i2.p1 TRINITY_DN8386_c0_g2~~TRINITY_DN8386_c0_g2_i2.p1  ORF type:complete len:280 (+),score=34.54 TRINITY_DN8386_c0_g2_i2:60-899(+)